MNRKTLTTIIILVVIILLSLGAYFYFSKKTSVTPTTPRASFPEGSRPITSFAGTGTAGSGATGTTFTPGSSATLPRLYELHKLPVAGVGFFETGKGLNHSVSARYIERGLGHIYETPLSTLVESRIVNETRSKIMEALWGNNGKSVVIRSIDDKDGGVAIKTSVLNLAAPSIAATNSTSTAPTSGFIRTEEVSLPDYIPFVAIAEDMEGKLFYLEKGAGISIGSVSTFNNVSVSKIFETAFTEWLPQFPNQQLATITTKPSANVAGHLFFINQKTKSVTKVLGGINGLTTLTSRNGDFVLFSETKDSLPELSVYNVVKKSVTPLLSQTLPEKCVWGIKNPVLVYCAVPQAIQNALYPDQWYQGFVTFSDSIWEINTATGISKKIMTPSDFNAQPIDIINPAISSDDSYLVFINKTTGNPWMYQLSTVEVAQSSPAINTSSTTPAAAVSKKTLVPNVVTSDMQQIL